MKIIGTGSALPGKVVTNEMLSGFLDTSDEWIKARTGVSSRYVISEERLEDLAIEAARKALDDASIDPADLDFIICSSRASSGAMRRAPICANDNISPLNRADSLSIAVKGAVGNMAS